MLPATKNKRSAKKNAGTQTSEMDTILEIARLQEQVKLLTIENEHLRKYTIEKPSSILNATAIVTSPTNIPETPKHSEMSKQKKLENQSTRKRNSKAPARGCNCKGNCSSKQCGCTKKDTPCGEWCKCTNTLCQNQGHGDEEQDKENVEENVREGKEVTTNKHLAKVTVTRGLFSPDAVHTPNIDMDDFSPTSLYFGSPKKLTFECGEEEEEKEKQNKKLKKKPKNVQKETIQRRGRPRKNNLEVTSKEQTRRQRSASNHEKTGENDMTLLKHELRKCTSSDMSIQTDKFEEIEQRTEHYVQNIRHGMVSLRRGHRAIERLTEKAKAENIAESNSKGESTKSGSCDTYEDDFDPMKPKHELPRTPTHGSKDSSYNTSNVSLPTPIILNNTQEDLPVPTELTEAQVDWDVYQSQLVACNKCNRRFHPFRVKKHQACCKKV